MIRKNSSRERREQSERSDRIGAYPFVVTCVVFRFEFQNQSRIQVFSTCYSSLRSLHCVSFPAAVLGRNLSTTRTIWRFICWRNPQAKNVGLFVSSHLTIMRSVGSFLSSYLLPCTTKNVIPEFRATSATSATSATRRCECFVYAEPGTGNHPILENERNLSQVAGIAERRTGVRVL